MMRRFRAPTLPGPGAELLLEAEASHHLLRVTGIGPGEVVELHDGKGAEAEAALLCVEAGRARLQQTGPTRRQELAPLWLLPALLRGPAFDLVLRMGTELGATLIWPVLAERSVARGDRLDRWERVVEAAATQCGRASLPELRPAAPLIEQATASGPRMARRIFQPGAAQQPAEEGALALWLGPEGGWTPAELAQAEALGLCPAGLGPLTLRADTATIVALARSRR
jgi:16S rRNA (uracil1498-N3)-methyltransferase